MSRGEQATTWVREDVETMAQCPGCGQFIEVPAATKKGSFINCPECGEQLEVISLRPPDLDYALDYENWDDEWEDEDN